MTNQELFAQVKALNFPLGSYAVFGSGPMGIRDIKLCHDVDLIVLPGLWQRCRVGDWSLRRTDAGSEYLVNGDVELWKDWYPGEWDIDQLIRDSEVIEGLPFVSLNSVVIWKRRLAREKDIVDIATIERYLAQR